jgi:hypothetical protein
MAEGMHYIVVRATMKNGERAITRMLVQVDKTAPEIRLISPEPGASYNTSITFSATATDDIEMTSLTYHLRPGDKSMYAVPGFLQGLYVEGTIPPFIRQLSWEPARRWDLLYNDEGRFYDPTALFAGGVTYVDAGLGLSFFDDKVKLQVNWGMMSHQQYLWLGGDPEIPMRYGGHVLGLKLLASVFELPFGSFMGPDWEWLSATFALGANFSCFNFLGQENPGFDDREETVYYTQSGKPTWLSALLLQIEFPRITLPRRKNFRTFSVFTEGQLWFIPTDMPFEDLPIAIFKVTTGIRLYIF